MDRRRRDREGIKGWKTLCADVSWEDYGGTWAKKAKDGSWYVLQWTNMWEACGERDCKESGNEQFYCEVKRIYFPDLDKKEVDSALRCCGWAYSEDGLCIVNEHDGKIIAGPEDVEQVFMACVEACISYGLGAPLEAFTGNVRPRNVRAAAKRCAEELMKDHVRLDELLDRPVNALGSTAREYGRGDINSAMLRGDSQTHQIMRKMHGIPEEHRVQFGTLNLDGTLTNVRRIKHSDMRRCPHFIMMADHYREDGSCRCDDLAHRQMMIDEWEYTERDFKGIPLRK